jgi:hypothetical protein
VAAWGWYFAEAERGKSEGSHTCMWLSHAPEGTECRGLLVVDMAAPEGEMSRLEERLDCGSEEKMTRVEVDDLQDCAAFGQLQARFESVGNLEL